MSLFDALGGVVKGVLQQEGGQLEGALLSQVLGNTNLGDLGDLGGLVQKLQTGGLGAEVASWLGNGSNMPVTADQLQAALGNSHVQDIARSMGIPVDTLLPALAQQLPALIDKLSPNGQLTAPAA
ncbi:MAG: DUF937 domain-containing protein [Proteobacteria bacterium]|nr:DUF937 domain-containing protein [Pseudomonadota bacterium]